MTEFGKHAKIWPNFKYHKSLLGCAAPLGQPRSVYKSDLKKVYKSDVECHFLESCDKMAKRPWKSRLLTAIRCILGANLVILAQIKSYYADKPNFQEFLVKMTKVTLKVEFNYPYFLNQLRVSPDACLIEIWWFQPKSVTSYCMDKLNFPEFYTSREHPMMHVCANLVIPTPFCDELLCRQEIDGWTDGQTDGQVQAKTIPIQPERPSG